MRSNKGPALPVPTGLPSSRVTGNTPRVEKASQISSALAKLLFGDAAAGARDAAARRELRHHIARRARQDVMAVGRRMDFTSLDHVDRGGRALGELAALEQDGLECAGVGRELLQERIRQERGRLDVAPGPADVLRRDGCNALFEERRRDGLEGVGEGEYRRLESRRPGVISGRAPRLASPGNRRIDRRRRCARPGPCRIPSHSACVSGGSMRMPARLRASRSRCSRSRNGRLAYTGTTSYTASPNKNARSSGETRASASGRNCAIQIADGQRPLLIEPEPDGVDQAAPPAALIHRRQRMHGQRREGLSLRASRAVVRHRRCARAAR